MAERVEVRPGVVRRKLVPNPAEASLHNEVFRLYLSEGGAKAVAQALHARGALYRDGAPWAKGHVLSVLEETAAIGAYYWGRVDSKTGVENPQEDWIAIPCAPIIDQDLFEAAQRLRAERDPKRTPGRTAASPLLLAGLVVCSRCGAHYTLETSGKMSGGEYVYRYYNCGRFLRSGKGVCPGHRVAEGVLDGAILEHVASQVFTEERCRQMFRDLVEEAGLLRSKADDQRRATERQLEEVERKLARWVAAFEDGTLDPRDGAERVRELRAQRDELAETLRKVRPLGTPPAYLYKPEVFAKFQAALKEAFLGGESAATKQYLRFLLKRIVVEGDVVHVEAKTEAAARMMAYAAGGESFVNHPEVVLTNDLEWLRR
jgi:site-specific DNA recombinase